MQPDGVYFEQSTYYHVYALDFFLLHAILDPGIPAGYRARLTAMAEYLEAVQGPSRTLPFLGDDDGGRLFHPYGRRDRFGRATLATAGLLLGRDDFSYDPEDAWEQACWWLGPPALRAQRHSKAAAPAVSRNFPNPACASWPKETFTCSSMPVPLVLETPGTAIPTR